MSERRGLSVRRLTAEDAAGWRPLWEAYLRFYRHSLPDELTRRLFERLCAQADGMAGLLAVDTGGRAIGLAHLVFHASTWTAASYCYIEDLYVERGSRGAGVGRAIMEEAFREADARGATRVYWHTQEYNAPARSLYDQLAHRTSFIRYER